MNLPSVPAAWLELCPDLEALATHALRSAYGAGAHVLPPAPLTFRALDLVPPGRAAVVILGLDPYPTPGHAMGLSFSVPYGTKWARTLGNIAKEFENDLALPFGTSDLTPWAERGVLLANVALTLEAHRSRSHLGLWKDFAEAWIGALAADGRPRVWLMWGEDAKDYSPVVRAVGHNQVLLETSHPSPLAARHSFTGSRPFSSANRELEALGMPPIDWRLDPQPDLFA